MKIHKNLSEQEAEQILREKVFGKTALYLHKRHNIEFSTIKNILNIVDSCIEIGDDELREQSQKIIEYTRRLQKILEAEKQQDKTHKELEMYNQAVLRLSQSQDVSVPSTLEEKVSYILDADDKERYLEKDVYVLLVKLVKYAKKNKPEIIKILRLLKTDIQQLIKVIQQYEGQMKDIEYNISELEQELKQELQKAS